MSIDADQFAATLAQNLPFLPSFPGNAQPTILIPDPITGENQVAGQDPANASWTDYLKTIASTPISWAHSAYDEVTSAPSRAAAFVEGTIKNTTDAVTGFVGW